MVEEWRQITIEDEIWDYEVSNCGQVRNMKTKRILKLQKTKNGYLKVTLCKSTKKSQQYVHRLVGIMFLPMIDGKDEINHINQNKEDNHVSNLEWTTHEENIHHEDCIERGANKRRKRVRCVETGIIYKGVREACRELGLHSSHVSSCCKHNWKTTGGFHWEYVN